MNLLIWMNILEPDWELAPPEEVEDAKNGVNCAQNSVQAFFYLSLNQKTWNPWQHRVTMINWTWPCELFIRIIDIPSKSIMHVYWPFQRTLYPMCIFISPNNRCCPVLDFENEPLVYSMLISFLLVWEISHVVLLRVIFLDL